MRYTPTGLGIITDPTVTVLAVPGDTGWRTYDTVTLALAHEALQATPRPPVFEIRQALTACGVPAADARWHLSGAAKLIVHQASI